ncbi:MAG: AAA family ATPase [Pseudomonadota bacterium]|nr:AAA family ATPase [Pseudomonadota bacterium]
MYLAHYGLTEPPFSITPDPRFVFLSERHRDALAHLLFGVDQGGGGGFVQLTGEVGTGKTTLCRVLLEQLPENARVALVLNPQLSPVELLETICEELRLDVGKHRGSLKGLVDLLNAYLLDAYSQGLHVVLIIDEAQNLSAETLEQVRLLTNLETPTQKLLQIILLGQPELRTMLARTDLRQLAQRITARYHLTPLQPAETAQYLRHRWRMAGGQHFPFTPEAVRRIHKHAGGVPRLINVIAERTLLAGYAHDESTLHRRWVDRAAREALAPGGPRWRNRPLALGLAAVIALVATGAMGLWWWLPPAGTTTSAAAVHSTTEATSKANALSRLPAPDAVPLLDERALSQRLQSADATSTAAWRNLLDAWQLPSNPSNAEQASACVAAVAPGILCARGTARLDKLATLGRPALLRMRVDGTDFWAVLLGLDAVNARLRIGEGVFDVDRVALEGAWTGEYAALWSAPAELAAAPMPSGSAAVLATGARGAPVEWVAEQLQPRYLAAGSGEPPQVDAAMHAAVREYQRARGLATDGVIGPETLMALTSAADGARLLRTLE